MRSASNLLQQKTHVKRAKKIKKKSLKSYKRLPTDLQKGGRACERKMQVAPLGRNKKKRNLAVEERLK